MSKFTGNEAAYHIHKEGRSYHLKVGKRSRYDFRLEDATRSQEICDLLNGMPEITKYLDDGKDACLKWFKEQGYTPN